LLTTFRRDGTPVPTVVWFGLEDAHAYVRTEERTGKLKRIRSNPHVRVAPCDIRGKPLGPTAEATARILGADDASRAERVIRGNYGFPRQWFEGGAERLGLNSRYIEISPGAPEHANRRGERGKGRGN
jgi:PPOX class probable F420-dependent enzyme